MLIKTDSSGFSHPVASEITPQAIYEGRRDLLKLLATGVAGAGMASWAARDALAQAVTTRPGKLAALAASRSAVPGALAMDKPTSYQDATSYYNF